MRVAIIGAGFSGCFLARQLEKKNIDVTLFEKSRGVGGRMATRRDDVHYINHGCSSIIPTKVGFKVFCEDLANEGLLKKNGTNHYHADQMNTVLKHLSQKVNIKHRTVIKRVERNNEKYTLTDQNNTSHDNYDFLIFTIPAPQILALKQNLDSDLRSELNSVKFDSVIALALYGDQVKNLDKVALSKLKNLAKLSVKNEESLVFHMDAEFSSDYKDLTKKDLEPLLIEEIQKVLPSFNIDDYSYFTHLWRYGFTKEAYGKPYICNQEAQYAICADWLLGNSVEDAYRSVTAFLNNEKLTATS